MRILYLGGTGPRLRHLLSDHDVWQTSERLDVERVQGFAPDLVLSYGYRFKVAPGVIASARTAALNVHISLLPWNGGADPNLWSWLTNTPKGVSVHWMSEEIDRGDLMAQEQVPLDPADTLRGTYELLQDRACRVLEGLWDALLAGAPPRLPMPAGGSYHRAKDKDPHLACLEQGWDTPCATVADYGHRHGLWLMEE